MPRSTSTLCNGSPRSGHDRSLDSGRGRRGSPSRAARLSCASSASCATQRTPRRNARAPERSRCSQMYETHARARTRAQIYTHAHAHTHVRRSGCAAVLGYSLTHTLTHARAPERSRCWRICDARPYKREGCRFKRCTACRTCAIAARASACARPLRAGQGHRRADHRRQGSQGAQRGPR
jgi:hypothetical protein